jgi:hypothetical protein
MHTVDHDGIVARDLECFATLHLRLERIAVDSVPVTALLGLAWAIVILTMFVMTRRLTPIPVVPRIAPSQARVFLKRLVQKRPAAILVILGLA